MNKNPKRKLFYLLCVTLIYIFFPFSAANSADTAELSGFSCLRNDDKNLLKPMGSSVETTKSPVGTHKETPLVKPVAEKEDVSGTEEETFGLKTTLESKEILISPLKPVIKRKTEDTVILPEESEFFMKLSKEEESLPKVSAAKRSKPLVIPVTTPITVRKPVRIEKPKRIKVVEEAKEEVKVVSPVITTIAQVAPIIVKEKKKGFVWKNASPILRRGLIISGLASMLLIFLIVYLWQKGSPVPEEIITEDLPGGKIVVEKNKFLDNEIREIKIGYRGLEKLINDIEKKLVLIAPLKGANIDEFLNNTVREVVRPIEGGIKSLQTTCQGLEKMFNEFDKRLSPLNALKGLSIKELTYQTGMELVKPIEGEIKQLKTSYDRLLEDVEQKISADDVEAKIDVVQKKNKGLEKIVENIDNRLVSLDSLVSSLSLFEGSQPGNKTQLREQVKPESEEKVKNSREYLYSQIYKMSDEGLSIDEIAQQTKMGKGEVRLILGLRKK
ncbi:DUF2802 domain-containing protein [bacterium]|nr:DUF2802 domain-containing protein [bacterium]MBU1754410.1 DUF2802 domain-containing protein [bacterium]